MMTNKSEYEHSTTDLHSSHVRSFMFSFDSSRPKRTPTIFLYLGFGILGVIASVIVLSLIPVYLPPKDINLIQNPGIE